MRKPIIAIVAAAALAGSSGIAAAQGGMPSALIQSSQPHPQISQVYQGDSGPYAWLLDQLNGAKAKTAVATRNEPGAHAGTQVGPRG
ncbi:MAG: lipoprotein [Pseudomonadota bacterium]|nr:lipoprotein [Pseudomonadota bacterium]